MNNIYALIIYTTLLLFIIIYIKKKEYFIKETFQLDNKGKFKIYEECKFSGMGFNNDHEIGECSVAYQIIPLCTKVLEIGGGAGKVSHIINKILSNKGYEKQHVVVEPGDGGHKDHIYINKKKYNDKYTIVKKYINDITMDDLKELNGNPDCLYVDCEGCLNKFQNTQIGKYILNNVTYIVNEMDSSIVGNEELRKQWTKLNFERIGVGYGCRTSCDTEIWKKIQI